MIHSCRPAVENASTSRPGRCTPPDVSAARYSRPKFAATARLLANPANVRRQSSVHPGYRHACARPSPRAPSATWPRRWGSSSGRLHHDFGSMDGLVAVVFEQAGAHGPAATRGALEGAQTPVDQLRVLFATYGRAEQDMAFQLWLDAWSEAARRPTLQAMSQRLKRRVAATVGRGHSRRARLGDFSCADPEATSRSARIRWSPVRSPCRTRARSGSGHPWLSACLGKSAALRTVAAGQRVKRSPCDDGTGAGTTRRTSTVAGVHASTTGGNRTSRIDRIAE